MMTGRGSVHASEVALNPGSAIVPIVRTSARTGEFRELLGTRVLRALASLVIFAETDPHRFALTELAQPLRSDVPGSLRASAVL